MVTNASCCMLDGVLTTWGTLESPVGIVPFRHEVVAPSAQTALLPPNRSLIAGEPIRQILDRKQLALAAENLVSRARSGDQNAMAILMAMAQNAKLGVTRAQVALELCKAYIDGHPVTEFGADSEGPSNLIPHALQTWVKARSIHRYPQLMAVLPLQRSNPHAANISSHALSLALKKRDLGRLANASLHRSSFLRGARPGLAPMRAYGDSAKERAEFCGRVVGFAFRLLMVPETIRGVAWELGDSADD
jgi:hypothetical protein